MSPVAKHRPLVCGLGPQLTGQKLEPETWPGNMKHSPEHAERHAGGAGYAN